jgi:hypothetical protein
LSLKITTNSAFKINLGFFSIVISSFYSFLLLLYPHSIFNLHLAAGYLEPASYTTQLIFNMAAIWGGGGGSAFFLHYRWEISEDFSGECKMGVVTSFRNGNSSAH